MEDVQCKYAKTRLPKQDDITQIPILHRNRHILKESSPVVDLTRLTDLPHTYATNAGLTTKCCPLLSPLPVRIYIHIHLYRGTIASWVHYQQ